MYSPDPACQAINIRDKCYRLDPSCPTYTGFDKNNETIVEVSEIKDPNVVIYSVLGAMLVLLVTIIVYLLWERTKLKKGIKIDIDKLIVIYNDLCPVRGYYSYLYVTKLMSAKSCKIQAFAPLTSFKQGRIFIVLYLL